MEHKISANIVSILPPGSCYEAIISAHIHIRPDGGVEATIIVVTGNIDNEILPERHPMCYNAGDSQIAHNERDIMAKLEIFYEESGDVAEINYGNGHRELIQPRDEKKPGKEPKSIKIDQRGKSYQQGKFEKSIISTYEFFEHIPDEAAALAFIEDVKWGDGLFCPLCASENCYKVKSGKPLSHRCRTCDKYFNVRTNSVLVESNIPLRKWLYAIYLFHTGRAGVSSHELARNLGITQKSAWFMAHRIREGMGLPEDAILGGEVEIDETYVGGRLGRMHKHKREEAREKPNQGKTIVMGIRERRTGRVWTVVVPDTARETLQQIIGDHVRSGGVVYTDGHEGYTGIDIEFSVAHEVTYHSGPEKQYVRDRLDKDGNPMLDGNGEIIKVHTNSIESFWALFKRGYRGVYFYMSPKHLHRYLNESAFRHGTGNTNNFKAVRLTVSRLFGKRLTHKQLTGKASR